MTFLILVTGWMTKAVMAILIGLSVWSIAIMIERRRAFERLSLEGELSQVQRLISERDWKGLQKRGQDSQTVLQGAVAAALSAAQGTLVDRSVRRYLTEQRASLEKGMTVLATLGSNAPFIGLFGTVLGIIQAFGVLASNPSESSAIMFSLAEALVATAVGLFVAIPAVVAHNVFAKRIRGVVNECESMRDHLVSVRFAEEG